MVVKEVLSQILNGAAGGFGRVHQHVNGRGFARTVWVKKCHCCSSWNVKGDALYSLERAVVLGEIADLECNAGHLADGNGLHEVDNQANVRGEGLCGQ